MKDKSKGNEAGNSRQQCWNKWGPTVAFNFSTIYQIILQGKAVQQTEVSLNRLGVSRTEYYDLSQLIRSPAHSH